MSNDLWQRSKPGFPILRSIGKRGLQITEMRFRKDYRSNILACSEGVQITPSVFSRTDQGSRFSEGAQITFQKWDLSTDQENKVSSELQITFWGLRAKSLSVIQRVQIPSRFQEGFHAFPPDLSRSLQISPNPLQMQKRASPPPSPPNTQPKSQMRILLISKKPAFPLVK